MIKKQKIILHEKKIGTLENNKKIFDGYGYSPILDPVIKSDYPIMLNTSLRCYKNPNYKNNPSDIDNNVSMSDGENLQVKLELKMFTNEKESANITYSDTIKKSHDIIYNIAEHIEYKLPFFAFNTKKTQIIRDIILTNISKKCSLNYRGPMNIIMVGKNIEKYLKYFIISNKECSLLYNDLTYIEYSNNKLIGIYCGACIYSDPFIDENSIFMTYISKNGCIDRGYYPLLYNNKLQIIDPWKDVKNYSTYITLK